VATGQLAMIGNPLGVFHTGYQTAQDVAMGLMEAPNTPRATNVALPEGVSAFVAGGYLDGSARPLPNLITGKKDDLSGWYLSGGLEKQIDDRTIAGFSASYSHGKGDTALSGRARSSLFQLTAYGTYSFGGGAFVNATVAGGLIALDTRRQFTLGSDTARLHNRETAPIFSGELALGYDLKMGGGLKLTPTASIRGSHLEFEGGTESGGTGSLTYAKRDYDSVQGRLGGSISFDSGNIRPHVDAAFVHDFHKNSADILAHFTGAEGPGLLDADFGSFSRDRNWGEVGGGLSVTTGAMDVGISADTIFKRQDLSYRIYRGSVTFHF
jgi:subtilase-type serine protease